MEKVNADEFELFTPDAEEAVCKIPQAMEVVYGRTHQRTVDALLLLSRYYTALGHAERSAHWIGSCIKASEAAEDALSPTILKCAVHSYLEVQDFQTVCGAGVPCMT